MLALLALLASACATLSQNKQLNLLDPTLSAYTGAIRWGNMEAAAGFARPRGATARKADPVALTGLKITGYKVRINRINPEADEAHVSISFAYYHDNQASIRQVHQNALWYFSKTDNTWYLDDNLPDFSR